VVGPPPVKAPVVLSPKPTPEPAPTGRHTVQPGETLYGVARLYGLRPLELLAYNGLDSSGLKAGQVLLLPTGVPGQVPALPVLATPPASAVPGGAVYSPGIPLPPPPIQAQPDAPRGDLAPSQDAPDSAAAGSEWRGLALSLLGVPYVYGGSSRSGTDCSGLVIQVFSPLGLNLPRQSALQAQTGLLVDLPDLQAGDLLFFDTEGRGTVTHVGIFLGDYQGLEGAFINANSFGGRVVVNQLGEKYFAQRYLWARRVIGVLALGH
jgi:peptidoglycan DL-endopeptidase LytE